MKYKYQNIPIFIGDFILEFYDFVSKTNWLFVCIDSARGVNSTDNELYGSFLESLNIKYDFKPEGVWIKGENLMDICLNSSLVVPYSAAYIFHNTIISSIKPSYNYSSEMGSFASSIPATLESDIISTGASGYVADGDGLNYCFLDNEFCNPLLTRLLKRSGDVCY
jgi:hypothetical protein